MIIALQGCIRCWSNLFKTKQFLLPVICLFAVSLGCSKEQPPELHYVSRAYPEELEGLPLEHLEETMVRYFGTPQNPTVLIDGEPEEVEVEEASDTDKGDDGEADGEEDAEPTIPLVEVIDTDELRKGAKIYNRRCLPCHGATGDGNGPVAKYMNPLPRDFRLGIFKFKSTQPNAKPRRADIARTIVDGARGTSMPSFRFLPDDEIDALITYVMGLSHRGEFEYRMSVILAEEYYPEDEVEPELSPEIFEEIIATWEEAESKIVYPVTPEVVNNEASILRGQELFLKHNCSKCHGQSGRGQTKDNSGKDAWGNEAHAADLTAGMLHGGP